MLESGKLLNGGSNYEWNKRLIGENKEMAIIVVVPIHIEGRK